MATVYVVSAFGKEEKSLYGWSKVVGVYDTKKKALQAGKDYVISLGYKRPKFEHVGEFYVCDWETKNGNYTNVGIEAFEIVQKIWRG